MKKKKDYPFASVVIVAAGRGTRMNMDVNKQYIEVCGVPVLARTLKAFEDCEAIREIIIVVNVQDIVFCKQEIVDAFGFTKVKSLVAGGSERQYSVYNGLKEVDPECEVVLVHDGARPFIREKSILDSIDAALESGASGVGVPAKDTVKACSEDGYIRETLDRRLIWTIQTPQTFRYGLILEAHRKAEEDGFLGTDDTMLAERMGIPIKLVMGSYDNIKITTQEDLAFAEAIVRSRE